MKVVGIDKRWFFQRIGTDIFQRERIQLTDDDWIIYRYEVDDRTGDASYKTTHGILNRKEFMFKFGINQTRFPCSWSPLHEIPSTIIKQLVSGATFDASVWAHNVLDFTVGSISNGEVQSVNANCSLLYIFFNIFCKGTKVPFVPSHLLKNELRCRSISNNFRNNDNR